MKTVSLELAKQLKEAGFPQQNIYFSYWDEEFTTSEKVNRDGVFENTENRVWVAPTAEEILDRLPKFLIDGYPFVITIIWGSYNGREGYGINYFNYSLGKDHPTLDRQIEADKSLAEAAGKMWLCLKENNLI